MLPLQLVVETERLLNSGELSQRAIARRLGVSRGIVHAIANGRRGLFGREQEARSEPADPSRCPGCGLLVTLPCVYCRAVDYASRRRGRAAVRRCAA